MSDTETALGPVFAGFLAFCAFLFTAEPPGPSRRVRIHWLREGAGFVRRCFGPGLPKTALLVAGLGFVKFKQIQTAIAQGAAFQPPPEAVTTMVAAQEQWPCGQSVEPLGFDSIPGRVVIMFLCSGCNRAIHLSQGRPFHSGDGL